LSVKIYFRLRELSNYEKQENNRIQKELEAQKAEVTSLTKDRDKLINKVSQLEEQIIELKEQVSFVYLFPLFEVIVIIILAFMFPSLTR
jgi:uncharacterized membrane protein (DUF106 family)